MDWLTAATLVFGTAGITIGVTALIAVGALRRSLNEATVRHAAQQRKLAETLVQVNEQLKAARHDYGQLSDAHRQLRDAITSLSESLDDGDGVRSGRGGIRSLH